MARLILSATIFCSLFLQSATAAPQRVVFEGPESTHKWALKELNPDLPSDWTQYNFLVLELRASTPQRFWLTLYSGAIVQRRQMHPMGGVWIRAAVPLQYFRQPNRSGHDMASVGKVPRNSFWVSTGGVYGPLNAVQELGVTMIAPLGFLQPMQIGVKLLLRRPGRAIDARQHRLRRIAAPIGARDLHQLEGRADFADRRHVRPATEIEPLSLPIDAQRFIGLDRVDEFALEDLALG